MNKINIIVIRWNGVKFVNSQPCKYCNRLLENLGVKNIYYSDDDGDIIYERVKNLKTDHLSMARRFGLDL